MADKRNNTCILYGDMIEYVTGDDALSDSQIAELFTAHLAYINGVEVVITDPEVKGIWRMAKSRIDRDNESYSKKCQKASANIKRRYQESKPKDTTESTDVYERIPNLPTYTDSTDVYKTYGRSYDNDNVNDNVNDNDNDNVNDNVNDNDISTNVDINIKENLDTKVSRKKKETAPTVTDTKAILDNAELEPEVREVLEEWLEYKKERREGYKPTGLKSLCSQIRNNVSTYGVDKVVNIIKLSMASNYVGILWARVDEQPKRKQSVSDEVSNEYLKRWGLA